MHNACLQTCQKIRQKSRSERPETKESQKTRRGKEKSAAQRRPEASSKKTLRRSEEDPKKVRKRPETAMGGGGPKKTAPVVHPAMPKWKRQASRGKKRRTEEAIPPKRAMGTPKAGWWYT